MATEKNYFLYFLHSNHCHVLWLIQEQQALLPWKLMETCTSISCLEKFLLNRAIIFANCEDNQLPSVCTNENNAFINCLSKQQLLHAQIMINLSFLHQRLASVYIRARLHQTSASRWWHLWHSSHWTQQSHSKMGCNAILEQPLFVSIVANKSCVSSVIVALTLHWRWRLM